MTIEMILCGQLFFLIAIALILRDIKDILTKNNKQDNTAQREKE